MAADIIARGMASKAAEAAKDALNELAQVVEGTMNATESEFTDSQGQIVTPDQQTVYLDTDTYVYYRWNGTNYYTVSDPRNTLKYIPQTLTDEEKIQARENLGFTNTVIGTGTFSSGSFSLPRSSFVDGLYFLTYGNCSTFLVMNSSMIDNSNTSPIRVTMPVIYSSDGSARVGILGIKLLDNNLQFTLVDGTGSPVIDGYVMTIIKTGIM